MERGPTGLNRYRNRDAEAAVFVSGGLGSAAEERARRLEVALEEVGDELFADDPEAAADEVTLLLRRNPPGAASKGGEREIRASSVGTKRPAEGDSDR